MRRQHRSGAPGAPGPVVGAAARLQLRAPPRNARTARSMAQEQGAPSGSKVSAELQAKYAGFRRPGIKDVWPPELFARINAKEDGLVVVDARTPEERQVWHGTPVAGRR